MEGYWKVHINDFDSFIKFILRRYKSFQNHDLNIFRMYYTDYNNDYIYLCIQYFSNDKYIMTYLFCSAENMKWFEDNGVIYMGEFYSRKKKLERLKEISKME